MAMFKNISKENEVTEDDKEIERLNGVIYDLQQEKYQLQIDVQAANKVIEEMRLAVDRAFSVKAELIIDNGDLRREIDKLRNELREEKNRSEVLEAKNEALNETLSAIRKKANKGKMNREIREEYRDIIDKDSTDDVGGFHNRK